MPSPEWGSRRGLWPLIRFLVAAAPMRQVAFGASAVIADALAPMSAIGLRVLTEGIVAGDGGRAMIGGAAMAGASVAVDGLYWTGMAVQISLLERVGRAVDERLMQLAGDVPGVEHLERSDYYDRIELLRDERDDLANLPVAAVRVASMAVRSAITLILLASIHPVLLLLPLFGVPSMLIGRRSSRASLAAAEQAAPSQRKTNAVFDLATDATFAKEVRIFSLDRKLFEKHRDAWREVDTTLRRVEWRTARHAAVGWALFAGGFIAAAAFVVDRAMRGQTTPGEVALALMLSTQINSSLNYAVTTVGWFQYSIKAASRFLWLSDYTQQAVANTNPAHPRAMPERIDSGIDFQSVSFTYPGTTQPILHDINLHLPAGSTVAVVGDNGAGKTTIVKLLCRLYEPTSGVITLDGTAATEFPPAAWRAKLSAAFQDYARFELLAREVVGVGDLALIDDRSTITLALERAAAADIVNQFEAGLEQQVGRSFDAGIELSGGQWQKLALGRGMMRDRPLVLVFDEPTAALDAHTEHDLFEMFATQASTHGRATGAITVLVSHRFSTVRVADTIVVISDGNIVESGSHEELMQRQGLYSELYELQARSYR